MEKWIKSMIRGRWLVIGLWITMVVLSVIFIPDLKGIVAKTESKFLPGDAEAAQASVVLDRMQPDSKERSNAVVVLHRPNGLKAEDRKWLHDRIEDIRADQTSLGVVSILTAEEQPDMAEKFRSTDGTTELALLGYGTEANQEVTKSEVGQLQELLGDAPEGASVRLTGSAPIAKEFNESSQNGLKKTELLTVVLVFGILLIVFRSPVTPLLPLLSIGLSFMLARGLVSWATDFGLPVSSFTESFLIAVLFGAGTDYCILILQRFREELKKGGTVQEALIRAYRGVGRTVIFASLTVFTAFFLIGFARFGLYRSASGVAIGMASTLAAALTLVPALLSLTGRATFWPSRSKAREQAGSAAAAVDAKQPEPETKGFWGRLAGFSVSRPGLVLVLALLLLAPLFSLFDGKRSFDDIAEIDPKLGSVEGFRLVEQGFGSGEVFPVTVTVESQSSFRTPEALAALEKVSARVAELDGVKEVRSAVRPLGKQLEQLTVPYQLKALSESIGKMEQGVQQVSDGLSAAGKQGANELAQGAEALKQVAVGMKTVTQIQTGMAQEGQKQLPGWFLPKEALDTPALQQAMQYYTSPDGTITKLEVVLSENPYSGDAMSRIGSIRDAVKQGLKGTAVASPAVKLAGTTAEYEELGGISKRDFVRTGISMLAGIFLVLVLLLRSVIAPVYILLSLGLNYLATMGLVEFFFVRVMGYSGLSWTVSFFVFLITVALGVDYSIFLMDRFKEEWQGGDVKPAMRKAVSATGGVVFSAALIMGGTFAALMSSGVDTLVQVGAGVVVGLLLYATLFIGMVVPATAALVGRANFRIRTRLSGEEAPSPRQPLTSR